MKQPKGFFTYLHHKDVIDTLSDEQAGRLYKALMCYGNDGEIMDFSDDQALNVAYVLLRREAEYNFDRYRETCERRSRAAQIREAKRRGDAEYDDCM